MVISKKSLALLLVIALFTLAGCANSLSDLEPEEVFILQIEGLREVESYKAEINVTQDFAGLGTIESQVLIYENLKENSFYYATTVEGERVMEMYQLDNIFTITFNIMGVQHTETFVDDEFEQITTDILIMEAFQDMDAFTNLEISENRREYIIKGDTTITALVDNEILSLDELEYGIESSEITIYVEKENKYISKILLETIIEVDGEEIISSAEMSISDINDTNNIKEIIGQ